MPLELLSLEALRKIDEKIQQLQQFKTDVPEVYSYGEHAIQVMNEAKEHRGRPLGFKTLDYLIGGVSSGEMIVISAPTGVGKSTLAKTITWNLAKQNRPSLWYSLEESMSGFLQAFVHNDPEAKIETDGRVTKISTMPIYWPKDICAMDFEILERTIRYSNLQYGVEHVFIDHLSYILDPKAIERSRSISIHIGDRLRRLRQIALGTGVSIFLVAHIGKIEDGKEPTLNDLRDSSFVGQEADVVLMLSRRRLAEPVPMVSADGMDYMETFSPIVRCKVEKARRTGTKGAFDLVFSDKLYLDPADSEIAAAIYSSQKELYANTDRRPRSKTH